MNAVGNGFRAGSPRSRRAFQIRRPNTAPANRRLNISQNSTNIRHTARRIIPKIALSSDAMTQRGNIQVAVRVRPTNDAEAVAAHRTVVQVLDEHMVIFDPKEPDKGFYYHGKRQQNNNSLRRYKDTKFAFDRVFATTSTNQEVFEGTIKRSLDTLLEGFNCSVFAYGATGSGKTFTMLGSGDSNPGLTILTMIDLYSRLEEMEAEYETAVTVSYLEVYNESVRDLLKSPLDKTGPINILEDENGVSIPHLTTLKPQDQNHLLELLSEGNRRRTQHPTDHNAESSRSHAVFQVYVTIRARFTDMTKNIRSAKLVMVDLAGSERGSATGCTGDRFREGASINKSLLALGNCINALADGKKHVPYRDSKLTRLLKDSLGGNCKTIIIANVSPSSLSYDDTHNTLKYANRAKHIRINVKKNEFTVSARLAEYSKVMQEMQDRINTLVAENELYKLHCNCLTSSKESTSDDSDSEGRDVTDGSSSSKGVVAFKNLKRRYEETRGMLSMTNTKIAAKRARLHGIDSSGDMGATKGPQKLQRQLSNLEETRKGLEMNFRSEKTAVENVVNAASPDETVPLPLSEVLRLRGLEVSLETLETRRDQEKNLLLRENTRAQNLLSKSMALVKSVYQLSHVQKQTTKKQDKDYEELRQEYLGYTKVRWADQEPPKSPTISNLNTTYAISLDGNF